MLAKALLINAASTLAAGVIANLPDNLAIDPDITRPETQAENLMAFRVAHVMYDGLVRAADPTNPNAWQTPKWLTDLDVKQLDSGSPLLRLLGDLAGGLSPTGPAIKLLGDLIAAIPRPAPSTPPATPIPSPADVAAGKP